MKEKVVLAYSGGLDTSYCVKYLSEELGLEVYTALANTGGFTEAELKTVEKKAYALGAKEHVNLDVTEDYYECIRYMVFGNVLRNKTYPVSVSSERTFQALAIVNYAKKVGAQYIAHGSTGAGNDQVRFDLCFAVFAPEMKVITPTRDLRLSRETVPESPWCPFRLEENGIFGKQRYMGNFCRGKRNFTFQYEFTG